MFNILFGVVGIVLITAGALFRRYRAQAIVKLLDGLCQMDIDDRCAAIRWVGKHFCFFGALITSISAIGVITDINMTFFFVLSLFLFILRMQVGAIRFEHQK